MYFTIVKLLMTLNMLLKEDNFKTVMILSQINCIHIYYETNIFKMKSYINTWIVNLYIQTKGQYYFIPNPLHNVTQICDVFIGLKSDGFVLFTKIDIVWPARTHNMCYMDTSLFSLLSIPHNIKSFYILLLFFYFFFSYNNNYFFVYNTI